MENNKPTEEQLANAEDLVAKAKVNKNSIIGVSIAIVVVIVGLLAWFLIRQEGSRKEREDIPMLYAFVKAPIAPRLYDAAAPPVHTPGNRAKAEMGIRLYQEGKYAEAAEYLSDCSLDDNIAAAGVATLEGDCYVNLDQYDKAISCYRTAESRADGNPAIVPFILVKEANVFRAQENYGAEAEAYRKIIDKFPNYSAGQVDIRTLYNRALTQSRQ